MSDATGLAGESRSLAAVRSVAHLLLRVIFRLRVTGLEHLPRSGPVILAGNHSGFLDGPIVFIVTPRPSAFLAKSELYAGPWRRVLDFAHQIPVRRHTPDRTALRRALEVLAAGGVLGVFPEGTRGAGHLETVQHGIGYLAVKAGCPIVPVACLGTADALPKGARVPRWRAQVDVEFGEPFEIDVDADPRSRRAVASAAEQIRRHLVDHVAAVAGRTGHPVPANRESA